MATELKQLHASFIYVESVLDALTGEVTQPPYSFLADRFAYAERFDETNNNRDGDIEPPWPDDYGRSFWSYYYSEQKPLDSVDGQLAWRGVTPFRHRFPLDLGQPAQAKLIPEAFVYSHGGAVVLTLNVLGSFTPDEMAALLVRLRGGRDFRIGLEARIRLDAIAARALTALRITAFGKEAKPGSRPPFPFTVVSVIRGNGVSPTTPIAQGGDEQRFLEAVTAWSPNWKGAQLPPLEEVKLDIRSVGTPAGHIVYARDRGRGVWFPGAFTLAGGRVRTLACFHRNLVHASLQVESLGSFAAATARMLEAGAELSDPHFDATRRATDVLGRFYGGAQSIYRSRSPHAQLEKGGFVADVNAVRAIVDRPPLFVPT